MSRVGPLRVLLVERDALAAGRIAALLEASVEVSCVPELRLASVAAGYDAVLLGLPLAQSTPQRVLASLVAAAPRVPVVALCEAGDSGLPLDLIRRGAQDCLVKDKAADAGLLEQTLRHAIQRKQAMDVALGMAEFPLGSPGPLLAVGADGMVIYANPAAHRMVEAQNGDTALLLPPAHHDVVADCLSHRRPRNGVLSVVGETVLAWSYQPGYTGDVVRMFGGDVTDSMATEVELRLERDFVSAVINTAGALIVVLDTEGRIVHFNPACERASGYQFADVAGKPIWDTVIPSDDRKTSRRMFLKPRVQDFPHSGENVWLARDGSRRVISWSNTAVTGADAAMRYIIATGIDITERKLAELALAKGRDELELRVQERTFALQQEVAERRRSEERYRALMNDAADAILLADSSGRILEANRRAEELLSYSAAELTAMSFEQLYPETERLRGLLSDIIETGSAHIADVLAWCKTGKTVPVDVSATVIVVGGQRIFQAILTDISDHKRAQEQLVAAKEAAELADRAKSEFLANMSHELRTPLNAIIGFSDVMRSQLMGPLGSPTYAEYARDINESGRHLLEVINEILDMSKVESGRVELNCEAVRVLDIIKATLRLIGNRTETAKLLIGVSVPQELPHIFVDERRVKQVLLNLLSNAVKFTPAGGKVDLVAVRTDDGGVSIAVSDTGIGMSRADMDKALAPFGQVDSRLARKYDGTGLGLPLAKAFIELHDGRLALESVLGAGTTVRIWLPPQRIVAVAQADVEGRTAAS